MRKSFLFLSCFLFLLIDLKAQLFTSLPSSQTGINFVNYIQENKNLNIITYEYLYNGAGVAVGDINNDGLADIYFSGNMVPNRLYINKGKLQFTDITAQAGVDGGMGYKTGVTMVDINNDGWLDIYVCKDVIPSPAYRANMLYINNKNGTFTERAQEYGLADSSYSTQAYFYDMDLDGDLDLYLVNHPYKIKDAKLIFLEYDAKGKLTYVKEKERLYVSDRFYENKNGKFVDQTEKAGLSNYAFGLSAVIADFNKDNFPDIYVCNDYVHPDALYINNKNGTYTDHIDDYFAHLSYNSMGSDYADINNDGLLDLLVLDMLPEDNFRQKQLKQAQNYDQYDKMVKYGLKSQYVKNVLQLQNRSKQYSDISYYAGIAFTDWSWAPLIADFDNDGFKDIYITNGLMRDVTDMDYAKFEIDSLYKELKKSTEKDDLTNLFSIIPSRKVANYFYKNTGTLKFKNTTNESGLNIPSWSNGAVYADLDKDGDLDLIVNNINDEAFVFRNNTSETKRENFLRCNVTTGYGTKLQLITPDGNTQTQVYMPTKGYMSSHEQIVHFGIGKNTSYTLQVTEPNGKSQLITSSDINKVIIISIATMNTDLPKNESKNYVVDISANVGLNYKHKENEYIDFKLEPLLPKRLSQLGPCGAVADVNGDQLQDIFIGGAAGFEASLFLQNQQGKFTEKKAPIFLDHKKYEDIGSAFFDADKDGDQDLLVVSGGNEFPTNPAMYPVRLYMNNGKGDFTSAPVNLFPTINVSGKAIAIQDYDHDGDMDIVIGGRTVPGKYGLIPETYLIKNEHGVYKIDNSNTVLKQIGMVTSMVWFDYDGDQWEDLIVVGEWMSVTIFKNNNGVISSTPTSLPNTSGWWNSITIEDVNQDGLKDILLGNYGVNTRYQCTTQEPMKMYVKDYDKNGSIDCIINVYNNGVSYPIAIRDNMLDQMVFLKKKYTRYHQYATTTYSEMFTEEQKSGATEFRADHMFSSIAINQGNGNFKLQPLPQEAQLFPVQRILTMDMNKDGYLDLILSGNDYGAEIETGRNDAGIGLVLFGNSSGQWKNETKSGFYTPGDVRTVLPIQINAKQSWIVLKNQGDLQVLSVK